MADQDHSKSRRGKIGNRSRITFIERLGPKCAIGADNYQWIVLQAHGPADTNPKHPNWDGQRWDAVGFIARDRQALIRCIKAKGLELSAEGQAALERQDAQILRWRRKDGAVGA